MSFESVHLSGMFDRSSPFYIKSHAELEAVRVVVPQQWKTPRSLTSQMQSIERCLVSCFLFFLTEIAWTDLDLFCCFSTWPRRFRSCAAKESSRQIQLAASWFFSSSSTSLVSVWGTCIVRRFSLWPVTPQRDYGRLYDRDSRTIKVGRSSSQ